MTKSVFIVGATGSVGFYALEKIEELGIKLHGFSFNLNIESARDIAQKFSPKIIFSVNEEHAQTLEKEFPHIEIRTGENLNEKGSEYLLESKEEFAVINAAPGMIGLIPSIKALESGRRLILANKESIVLGGKFLLDCVQYPNQIIPIDTEHYSIFKMISHIKDRTDIRQVVLTASGGPFLYKDIEEFEEITLEDALKHPVWNMGGSITVSSATLANKGLELMEAKTLFDLSNDQLDVLVHPEAYIHAILVLKDGSSYMHQYPPTIGTPIANALCFPKRYESKEPFIYSNSLTLLPPDLDKFPMLTLAYEVMKKENHFYQIVYSVANDFAVNLFLSKKIKFTQIHPFVKQVLDSIPLIPIENLSDVFKAIDHVNKYSKKNQELYL